MLDHRRRVRSLNAAAENLLGRSDFVWTDMAGRFGCAEPRLIEHIDSCLAHWHRPDLDRDPEMFLIARNSLQVPARVTVIVTPWNSERSFFRGPECILLIETAGTELADLREIKRFYGLTDAEVRVAAALASGLTVNEVAAQCGTSPATVRVHVRQVFRKLGVSRQVDLVRLVHALAGPGH